MALTTAATTSCQFLKWERLCDVYEVEEITQTVTHICGIVSMFGVGCTISLKDFQRKETRLAKGLSIGLFLQTLLQPFTGFLLSWILQLEIYQALAMIVVASAPTAHFTGALCYWGDGNVALSICLATLSTALSIGTMPMWFMFYSSTWSSQYYIIAYPMDIAKYLLIIIVPVSFGMTFKWCLPKAAKQLAKVCTFAFLVGVVACSLIFLVAHSDQFYAPWQLYICAVLLPFIGFFLGFLFGFMLGLPFEVCIAISLAVGVVNGPLAVTVTLHSFSNSKDVMLQVLKLPTIYTLFGPLEGIVWSMMYKVVDEIFSKAHPVLCGGSSSNV